MTSSVTNTDFHFEINKDADQIARMRRLICTFVVRIWLKTRFRMTWPISSGLINESMNFYKKQILFESMYDMDVSGCIDKISQEAYKCTHRADLPVQDTFLFSFSIVG